MKSWWKKVIGYGTYILVFLMPILYLGTGRYLTYATSKTFFFYGAVEIIFAVWLYQLFIDASYRFSKKDLIIFSPFLAYILWLSIAGIFGLDFEMSFWSSLGRGTGLLTLYHVAALVFVVASLIKKYGFIKYGYKLLAWFTAGASVLAISVWLGNEGFNLPILFLQESQGGGLMGNSSLTASVLLFAVFLSTFLLLAKDLKKKYKIIISIALALIIFSPLFISIGGGPISARGAVMGIIVGALAFITFYLAFAKEKLTKFFGVALIVLGIIVFIFSWNKLMAPGDSLHDRFAESASESRFIFWDIAKQAMKERPLLGYGPENYRIAYQKYFDPKIYTLSSAVEVWNDRAHNIIFDTGVAGGWPAIILYFVFLASLIYGTARAYIKEKISRSQAAVLGALVVAYFIQNLFVFDSLVSLMALGVLSGIILGANTSGVEEKSKKTQKKNSSLAAISIIVALIPTWVWFAWMPSRKAAAFSDVIQMSLNKRPEHYVNLLQGSMVGDAVEVGAIAEDSYKLYSENQKAIKADEKLLAYSLRDVEKLTEYLEIIAKGQPNDYRLRLNLARLYNIHIYLSGEETFTEKALAIEEEALLLAPNDPQVYWTYATTKFRSGDVEGAKELLKKAIEIAPYVSFSQELLDQFSK